jgi:thiamine biosynthesis lipoprotein
MRHAEDVMGTVVSFEVRAGTLDEVATRAALDAACTILHDVDAQFSTWKPDSAISRMRRGELDRWAVPAKVAEVLRLCAEARELSGGWFDPWRLPGGVDPTGLVKGWAAERALARLREAGVAAAMVNAGGDVAAFGEPEAGRRWKIGVRDPRSAHRLLTVVELHGALATSGIYERGQHVLDPNTGRPGQGLLSASVSGPDLALADALATGLLAGGEPALDAVASVEGYDTLVVRDDGTLLATGLMSAR